MKPKKKKSTAQLPPDPLSPFFEVAIQTHEIYRHLRWAGFNRDDALDAAICVCLSPAVADWAVTG